MVYRRSVRNKAKKVKVFTTSMNRKVCWEDGYKKGIQEERERIIKIIDKLKYDTFAMALKRGETLGTFLEYIKQKINKQKENIKEKK